MMSEERFLLKDFFNPASIGVIADAVHKAEPRFDRRAFLDSVFDGDWEGRELKQRMRHVAQSLRDALTEDYRSALSVLVDAATDAKEAGFAAMVFSDFVEAFGVHDFEASVAALEVFTKNVSAEFAVRPFLIAYPVRMLDQMLVWAVDENAAVRRLASEGTRPRLPWGIALKSYQADPTPLFPLLETLCHDPSGDVRRSVANSLNDISKEHPDLVVDLLARWQDGSEEVAEITKHALRTLLKQGHAGALSLLGFNPDPNVEVLDLKVDQCSVQVGGKVSVSFTVRSTSHEHQSVMIDGAVEYARARGTSTKVFKWKTTELGPGEDLSISRSISLRPTSTRRVIPGAHGCQIQVNGTRLARIDFEVVE